MRRALFLPAAVLLCTSVASHGRDHFVAPNGSDAAGDGSIERPFRTVRKGLSLAMPGDHVVLRGGEYRLADSEGTVAFPTAGEPDKPITLTAHRDEYAALLGSVRLAEWQPHEGKIHKCPVPARPIKGLYEDGERLTHPRVRGKREHPPVAALQAPGRWTVQDDWVYLWCREGDGPATHRIEASQIVVVDANRPWVRVEKLHVLFGQPIGLRISADHVVVDGVEVAHVANSVDNAYGAYFSGCSHSALRNSTIHDSYYWGDHGSNSHVVSCIDCGDRGPNLVENCDIFNGGLGAGTKGAARLMTIVGNRITDVLRGVVISGERSAGPGAGKGDRGHYLVYRNHFRHCRTGVYFGRGDTRGNRVYGNVFEKCSAAVHFRKYKGHPRDTDIANNVFLRNGSALYLVAERKGEETLPQYHEAGLRTRHNLFFGNGADLVNPIRWGKELRKTFREAQSYRGYQWEAGSIGLDPRLDFHGRPEPTSPTLGRGAPLALPDHVSRPERWHIGLGPSGPHEGLSDRGLSLSIDGSPTAIAPGQTLRLRAWLRNGRRAKPFALGGDAVLTFHFRYANVWHYDKQELHRTRVALPDRTLGPGESLDLAALPGWANPVNGKLGDPFHLRADDRHWRSGWRLRASLRFVRRHDKTAEALQRLEDAIRSQEVLRCSCAEERSR